jgi:hypothetical protein
VTLIELLSFLLICHLIFPAWGRRVGAIPALAPRRRWIDRKLLRELCESQCSNDEISAALRVDWTTLYRRPHCHATVLVESPMDTSSELNIHLETPDNLTAPSVWVFPDLMVCVHCGFTEFHIGGEELKAISERVGPDHRV